LIELAGRGGAGVVLPPLEMGGGGIAGGGGAGGGGLMTIGGGDLRHLPPEQLRVGFLVGFLVGLVGIFLVGLFLVGILLVGLMGFVGLVGLVGLVGFPGGGGFRHRPPAQLRNGFLVGTVGRAGPLGIPVAVGTACFTDRTPPTPNSPFREPGAAGTACKLRRDLEARRVL